MVNQTVKVLVVGDDADSFEMTCRLLEGVGTHYQVEWAHRFADAVAAIEQDDHEVYLITHRLGRRPDLDVLREITARRRDRPAILLTAQVDETVDLEAMQAGAADHLLTQDLSGPTLDRAIRYAIQRKRMERIERERQTLGEAAQAMEQVIGVIGHELRTPLAGLRAMSEYLLDEVDGQRSQERSGGTADSSESHLAANSASHTPNPGSRPHFLRSIHDEVVRLSDVVESILETARINSGAAQWRWSDLWLAPVAEAAVEVVSPLVNAGGVALQWSVEPCDLVMRGDADAIRRLILNLLTNAHRHTTEGAIRLTIREVLSDSVGEGDSRRRVHITVEDTGEGISPEMSHRLGSAFALNRGMVGSSCATGSGLGLAFCKGVVAAHGGRLSISSHPGGTTIEAVMSADLPKPDGPADMSSLDSWSEGGGETGR